MFESTAPIGRDEVDGVPVFWVDAPGPLSAVLAFRVGRADEIPARYGITHLVEHLTLAPLGIQADYDHNGGVEALRTTFEVSGSRADVNSFLSQVTRAISDLDTSRILVERAIIQREAEENGPILGDALRGTRFGGVGLGATAEPQFGIGWLGENLVRQWADERFSRANAIVVMSGPPDGLELHLRDGRRIDPPPPAPLDIAMPAFVSWELPAVAITTTAPRVAESNMVANILHRRMRSRLRFELGQVYDVEFDYDRIAADRAHITYKTETDERSTRPVIDGMLKLLGEMVDAGPTSDELAAEVAGLLRDLEHPDARLGYLYEMAFDELLGRPPVDFERLIEERRAVSSERAVAFAAGLRSELIVLVSGENPDPDRFTLVPEWAVAEVAGDIHAPAGWHVPGRGPKERLIVGPDGVTLRLSAAERLTIRYDDLIASVHEGETRTLVARDGTRIPIEAAYWRDGKRLVERIDAATPPLAFACSSHAEGGLEDPEGRT